MSLSSYVSPKPTSPTQKLRHENEGGKFSGLITREDIVDGPRARASEISDIRKQIDTAVRRYASPSDSKESMLLHIIKAVKSKDILPGEAVTGLAITKNRTRSERRTS